MFFLLSNTLSKLIDIYFQYNQHLSDREIRNNGKTWKKISIMIGNTIERVAMTIQNQKNMQYGQQQSQFHWLLFCIKPSTTPSQGNSKLKKKKHRF